MKVGVVAVIKGVVVWVGAAPLGRPVALTLGPPLNLPLGGGGRWLAGEGTVVVGEGASVDWATVVVGGGVAVNFGHPPARGARVPLRGAKGGGDLLLVAPSGVAALCSAESCEGLGRVGDDSPFVFGGAVFGEGVGECVGFVGTLSAVTFDDLFGFE